MSMCLICENFIEYDDLILQKGRDYNSKTIHIKCIWDFVEEKLE